MKESMKPRFVDLNDGDKQLGPSQPAPARNDPLAELARIVGQDDPFQSLLAGDRGLRRPANDAAASMDDLFVTREDGVGRHGSAGLRSTHQPGDAGHGPASYADYQARAEAELDTFEGQEGGLAVPAFLSEQDEAEPPRRGSRRALVTAVVVLGAAGLVIGGALMIQNPAGLVAGGEPPLIKATDEPTKVAPQSPGGVEIPNQNKQIYQRAETEGQTKVVNREEQPVDVRQAARAAAPAPAEPADALSPASAPQPGQALNLGEPRRVRTVTIRPDGTIATPDAPAAATRPAAPPAAVPTLPAAPRLAASAAPTTPTSTTPAPRAAASTPAATGGASPQPAAAPAPATPAAQTPQRVAAAQPMAISPTPQAAPPAAPAAPATNVAALPADAPAGGFAVQLGVSASEADARATLQRLQQKFPDLGGATPLIRRADVNGNTIYRVRVGPMSREEASSLCSKLQGQGGQCFVAKN